MKCFDSDEPITRTHSFNLEGKRKLNLTPTRVRVNRETERQRPQTRVLRRWWLKYLPDTKEQDYSSPAKKGDFFLLRPASVHKEHLFRCQIQTERPNMSSVPRAFACDILRSRMQKSWNQKDLTGPCHRWKRWKMESTDRRRNSLPFWPRSAFKVQIRRPRRELPSSEVPRTQVSFIAKQ